MSNFSTILRIIDGVKHNDIDMVIRYAKRLVPEDEYEILEKCIKEKFNPNAHRMIMDSNKKNEII